TGVQTCALPIYERPPACASCVVSCCRYSWCSPDCSCSGQDWVSVCSQEKGVQRAVQATSCNSSQHSRNRPAKNPTINRTKSRTQPCSTTLIPSGGWRFS